MTDDDSAIAPVPVPLSAPGRGWAWGLLGVVGFSLTVPLTRVAVADLSPGFVGAGRAVVAALLAGIALRTARQVWPARAQWRRLAVVAGGIVIGFPVLTAYALTTSSATHGAVVIAVLPAATAVAIVVRTRERPPAHFWVAAGLGAAVAVAFATRGDGLGALSRTDLLLLGAVAAAAAGYAEGGLLARQLGAWQTVSWALVLSAPVMVVLTALSVAQAPPSAGPAAWAAFAYLSVISMFLAFFAWYRGLALGPMAQVSQVQLAQPVLSLTWAALLLGEHLTTTTLLSGLAVVTCATLAVRTRQRPEPSAGGPLAGPDETADDGRPRERRRPRQPDREDL